MWFEESLIEKRFHNFNSFLKRYYDNFKVDHREMIDRFNMCYKYTSESYEEFLTRLRLLAIPAKIKPEEVKHKLLMAMCDESAIDFLTFN